MRCTGIAGAAHAGRYQSNSLYRMYYATAAKQELIGEAWLPCPSYSGSDGWQIVGDTSPYFVETIGPACPQGPITFPDP